VATIRWASEAADDLQAIHEYIARNSVHYAQAVCADIVAAVDQLARYPQLGRMVPEFQRAELRELLVGSYRIVYRVTSDDVVEVATVFHGARLLRLEGPS
jgi:plasmid stabilization system protein ParE